MFGQKPAVRLNNKNLQNQTVQKIINGKVIKAKCFPSRFRTEQAKNRPAGIMNWNRTNLLRKPEKIHIAFIIHVCQVIDRKITLVQFCFRLTYLFYLAFVEYTHYCFNKLFFI